MNPTFQGGEAEAAPTGPRRTAVSGRSSSYPGGAVGGRRRAQRPTSTAVEAARLAAPGGDIGDRGAPEALGACRVSGPAGGSSPTSRAARRRTAVTTKAAVAAARPIVNFSFPSTLAGRFVLDPTT